MSNRELKVITTPTGLKIEVLSYVTGREKRDIQNAMTDGIEFDIEGNPSGLTTDLLTKQEDKMIEICVKNVNGDTENVLNTVLDLKSDDYDALIKELRTLSGLHEEKKTI